MFDFAAVNVEGAIDEGPPNRFVEGETREDEFVEADPLDPFDGRRLAGGRRRLAVLQRRAFAPTMEEEWRGPLGERRARREEELRRPREDKSQMLRVPELGRDQMQAAKRKELVLEFRRKTRSR